MIRRGDSQRFLYLTASHPLLELVTKWILDYDTIRGVWDSLPVFLFRGFVRQVLTSARVVESGLALPIRTRIDTDDSHLKKSLLSQIMQRLVSQGELRALGPLAHRDGTVNTIATLIGEIQRAAKSPEKFREIVQSRAADSIPGEDTSAVSPEARFIPSQLDFDREIATIYEAYARALDQFHLTENDADQLRALEVLNGEVESSQVTIPWLDEVDFLVLDGFFDFTPVQGEMLRHIIQRIPNVIVNLYGDEENEEVFRPFAETLEQLRSMSDEFEITKTKDWRDVGEIATTLRRRLFNPDFVPVSIVQNDSGDEETSDKDVAEVGGREARAPNAPRIFRCQDRETEIREIAKEIKRLVIKEDVSIRDIGLIVRQRAAYADTISRVFAVESIPCNVERSLGLAEIPATRALLKLFQIIADDHHASDPSVADLAALIKSGYFRFSDDAILALRDSDGSSTAQQLELGREKQDQLVDGPIRSQSSNGYGSWNPDELENVVAYVGGEVRLKKWLDRANQLAANDKLADETRAQIFGENSELDQEEDSHLTDDDLNEDAPKSDSAAPTREIPSEVIKWTGRILSTFATLLSQVPREDSAQNLRSSLFTLLSELQFADSIRLSLSGTSLENALPHAGLDLRALDGIRQAVTDAVESIEIAARLTQDSDGTATVSLADFVLEVQRCIGTQSLAIASADRDGLQVLEATDVRGLQFRAVFIAGLIEGGFPLRKPRDWIYPHEERERLKQYGLTLEDISPATLLKEEHYFYQAACRATERLYLTFPLVVEGGNETVVSYYIDELKHALAPIELISEDKRRDCEGDSVFDSSSSDELAIALVRLDERHKHRSRKKVPMSSDDVHRLISWAVDHGVVSDSAIQRIEIGHERAGTQFGRYDGLITNEDLRSMLAARYGENYVWSASALSLYGKSPYKFFAQRVLKLEPRIEAALDLAALDAGGLLHEALRRFFMKHRRERLARADREKLRAEMRAIADQVFRERERVVPPLNIHVWKIDREIYQLQLAQVIDCEIELQNKNDVDGMLPAYFELGFGMERGTRDDMSKAEFLTMSRGNASSLSIEAIKLRGQIDRLDISQDGTIVAYDYKLSRGAKIADMIEGRDLQIGIYLDAIEQLFFPNESIAGGGYYVLRTCDRKPGLYRKDFDTYTHLGTRAGSVVDDDTWFGHRSRMRKRIWEFVNAIRAGRFVVDPSAPEQTCDICDYASVCRYEKFRILRKGLDLGRWSAN